MDEYRKYEPIFGSWYISRVIGKGSFGRVFEITREEFGTTYRSALKIIRVPQDEDELKARMTEGTDISTVSEYYEGLLREIVNENEIMAQLKGNSNIVSYEDHQIIPHEDGIGYDILIRMELLTPLIDRMIEKKLSEKEVVRLGIDICKALETCHRKNIIHRDIKPQNIFISDNGDFKLGDFGIARTMEKTMSGMSRKGTYKYMAPEVFKGEHYDSTADIYSLGIVLFSLLNGNRGPFLPAPPEKVTHNDEEAARMRRFRGEALPAPKEAGAMLSYIIKKACAYLPRDRYQTAEQMRRDLESYLMNYDVRTDSKTIPGQDEKTVKEESFRGRTASVPAAQMRTAERPAVNRPGEGPASVKTPPMVHREEPAERPAGRPERPQDVRVRKKGGKGRSSKGKLILAAVIGLILVAAAGGLALHLRSASSDEIDTDLVAVRDHDINFSQVEDLDSEPVNALIKVENLSEKPLGIIDYCILNHYDYLINREDGSEIFTAFGYVAPGCTGYMYSKVPLSADSPRTQGSIEILSAVACEAPEGYEMPYGELTAFDADSDSYDVFIYNPNDSEVNLRNAVVIAVAENNGLLADAWGCSTPQDITLDHIGAGADVTLSKAIHDPGFGVPLGKIPYTAFVIEKDIIGID